MLFVYILRISVHQYHHTTLVVQCMFYIITQPLWFYVNKCASSMLYALCSFPFSFIASDRQIEMKSSIKLTSLSSRLLILQYFNYVQIGYPINYYVNRHVNVAVIFSLFYFFIFYFLSRFKSIFI